MALASTPISRPLPPGWQDGGVATLRFRAELDSPRLLLRSGSRLRIEVLRLSPAELAAWWPRQQNYAAFADASGAVTVVEVSVSVATPPELLRALAASPVPDDAPGQAVRGARATGLVRLGVPVALVESPGFSGGWHEIGLRISRARIDLAIDGRIVDTEWPGGQWSAGASPGDAAVEIGAGVAQVRIDGSALGDDATGWVAVADPPLAQHWAPRGHNAWAGDTMFCVHDGKLHLYWLFDRRAGDSKWGCGGHQFAHHVTTDLRTWQAEGIAYPITESHELALGTGTVIVDADGVFHLYSRHCQERFGAEFERLHPGGMHHATSTDGQHFTKLGPCPVAGSGRTIHDLGSEPGILRDADGTWHAAAASTRLVSRDLHHWQVADADFLPAVGWPCTRSITSNECNGWFTWNGWFYILLGRTGFWMSRTLTGPYWGASAAQPAWDVYDGLMVPQAIVFHGRCILAGWLAQHAGFAGHLVFRELLQRPDGNLDMRRLPELEPRRGRAIAWTVDATDAVTVEGRNLLIAGGRAAVIPGIGADVRISARLRPRGCRAYGLRLLGDGGRACELRFEPARGRAQWGTSIGGERAPESTGMPFDGRDFSILGVEGLEGRDGVSIAVLVRRDAKSGTVIIDAQIDGRRTMVTRRAETGGELSFWADAGSLAVEGLAIEEITERIG